MSRKVKKVRDIVHGFIELDEQELKVINHPAFQRLRRIKQLALTDMVYPGASHTRFEHSLGVMQMVTNMYDCIVKKNKKFLESELSLDNSGIERYRKLIRLAALLHDVGHPPFSHSGEDLLPLIPENSPLYIEGKDKRYEHEDYSIACIKEIFKPIIEENDNYRITVDEVTALLGDKTVKSKALLLLWKELISGQIDADRADYLLRDSLHLGVNYGLYDRNQLIHCMTIGKSETGAPVIAIEDKSWNIAESLVLARYQMFSQVYFHKTRRIYDYHIYCATRDILKNLGTESMVYPSPENINDYLQFDDWNIYSALKNGQGGKHGDIILNRTHYKCIKKTELMPTTSDIEEMRILKEQYGEKGFLDDKASTTWYKLDKDINLLSSDDGASFVRPLSLKSAIVKSMLEVPKQMRFYIERSK